MREAHPPSRSAEDPVRPDPAPAVRLKNVHYAVLLGSFILTLVVWNYATTLAARQAELAFERAADQILALTTERMEKYEDSLWAGVGAIYTKGGMPALKDWRAFARTMQIDVKYPGINGIGVIRSIAKEQAETFVAEQRRDRPAYDIHPERAGDRLYPITYIEPEATNIQAVGLDVGFEDNRRAGLMAARDSGTAQITGPITLVQDEAATPGFLFYVPFYRDGPQATVAARRAEFLGAVYAPFVVKKLMQGVLAKERRHIWVRIADAGAVIYDEHGQSETGHDPDPMFSRHFDLDMYGRTWQIDLRTNAAFRAANERAQPRMILACGLTIDLLLLILFTSMARSSRSAHTYADQVTEALRREKQDLLATNEALEQFSYVASHDLKTPLRGMRDTTDYLVEELEDRHPGVLRDERVAAQLSMLRSLITRMDALVKGVLECAQISKRAQRATAIDFPAATRRIAQELGIGADHLTVADDGPCLHMDPLLFSRIMGNLLDNAVSHHHDRGNLLIRVAAAVRDGGVEISVADNGPGIAPDYHHKIFEMFQTLEPGRSEGSTGIGLAIVKKAASAAGGTVAVRSAPGRGSVFSVFLPAGLAACAPKLAAE